MVNEMMKRAIAPIIEEAYAEGYKKGAEDIVHRMAYIYDYCREQGRIDGMTDAGAIDIEEITTEQFEEVSNA